jgi:alpha-L-rhamnosidase
VVPWRLWQPYGDIRQLRDNYDAAKCWVEFIRSKNPDLLWKNKRGNDYGDWLNSDTMNDSTIPRKGGEVPKPVFATMMFAYATDLVSRMAAVLGNDAEAKQYSSLFNAIKTAFNAAYVRADGHMEGNTQAGYALALHFDLLPESKRAAAVAFMLEGIDAYHGHMSTGFHPTYRMMLELSRAGRSDVATFSEDVTIPANTTATVYVPAKSLERVTESGAPATRSNGVRFVRMEGYAAVFTVQSGTYHFVAR